MKRRKNMLEIKGKNEFLTLVVTVFFLLVNCDAKVNGKRLKAKLKTIGVVID